MKYDFMGVYHSSWESEELMVARLLGFDVHSPSLYAT